MNGSLETLELTVNNHIATRACNQPSASEKRAPNRLAYAELEQTFIELQNNQDVSMRHPNRDRSCVLLW